MQEPSEFFLLSVFCFSVVLFLYVVLFCFSVVSICFLLFYHLKFLLVSLKLKTINI